MIFGVALVPLMIGAGAGLDFVRAMMVRQQMAEALDAAALAVGSTPGLDAAKAQDLAQKYFDANYTVDKTQYGTVTIDPPVYDAKGSITLTAKNNMPTVLMKIVNINDISLSTTSTVVWGQTKLWVALVLDNSGSMSQGDASGSKMSALQSASHQLLTVLQNAAHTPGDVKVGIVPFSRSVNMGYSAFVSSAFIDWGEWDAPPANIASISGSVGPGSPCPFTSGSQGFRCTTGSANGSSSTNTVPASGLICPGIDNGTVNTAHNGRYYNGCWDSVPTQTLTTTTPVSTPTTLTQTCTQVDSNPVTCNTGSTSTGSATTGTVTTATTAGYTGDSTTSSTSSSTAAPTDGSHSCSTKKGKTTCTWTRTTVTTTTTTTVVKTGAAPYSHTWTANSHSSWGGCVTDRQRSTGTPAAQTMTVSGLRTAPAMDYDTSNTQPSSGDSLFPAENPSACVPATITTLSYDWTALATNIDAMTPHDSTNQAIGVEHGWQMITMGAPYSTPALPANTTRYIILLSDGLNTRDRWWGDGSTEGTTQDGYIDQREKDTCDHAKADGVIIYTIYVNVGNVGGAGNSAPLQYCATDSSKYFALTSTSAVITTFNQIAQQITNVRVSM
ncbi:MAG TPA: VWA domain-containing protein [Rhizomicrobium sp.]|nr:VWA domain-containing protein [Rhizomicrobium sp.]